MAAPPFPAGEWILGQGPAFLSEGERTGAQQELAGGAGAGLLTCLRGKGAGIGVPTRLPLPPSSLSVPHSLEMNGVPTDGDGGGAPGGVGSTCLSRDTSQPRPPCPQGWGLGRNPFLGCFLPHFPVRLSPLPSHPKAGLWPQAAFPWGVGEGLGVGDPHL